jgi:hypothetical protein
VGLIITKSYSLSNNRSGSSSTIGAGTIARESNNCTNTKYTIPNTNEIAPVAIATTLPRSIGLAPHAKQFSLYCKKRLWLVRTIVEEKSAPSETSDTLAIVDPPD